MAASSERKTRQFTRRKAGGAQRFVLVAHGGAGDYSKTPKGQIAAKRVALTTAMKEGHDVLASGGTSLDAVEATIRSLEDSGAFNAGRGAHYTRDGVPELDAAIMDGGTLNAGAVASVEHIANPISLARLVMEKTPHVLLVGKGAEQFAKSQHIPLASPYHFFNPREWKLYEKSKNRDTDATAVCQDDIHGTVGAVALDQAGNVAAGTSTGGTEWKMPGRVGDTPLIGAGTYANNDAGAISATGVGEYFICNVVAADICARVRYQHASLEQAAKAVLMRNLVTHHGEGGIVGVDRRGRVAMVFNTQGMIRGVIRADGRITIAITRE